jgi:hypothetical protein
MKALRARFGGVEMSGQLLISEAGTTTRGHGSPKCDAAADEDRTPEE